MSMSEVLNNASASLHVDLSAIIHNYQTLKSKSSSADCAAVVKADAYGIGMEHVAPAIYHHTECKVFFVANLVEGVKLRAILPDATIYVFNGLFADQVDTFIGHDIRPVLNNLAQIELWKHTNNPCAIHFDTGINRLGLSEEEADQFFDDQPDLNISLILSHFIQSELGNHPSNEMQLDRFLRIRYRLPDVPASLSNSGGIYLGPEYHFDLLRPGIMLYGGNPGLPRLPNELKHIFELRGKILQIRTVKPGMSVGYNSLWTAAKPSRVAIINVGYADGLYNTRDFNARVFLDGHMAPVIGKVSMDMIVIDITDEKFDSVTITDDVEPLGSNITLEMAAEVSTLGQYELLTGIGQRYNKNYLR